MNPNYKQLTEASSCLSSGNQFQTSAQSRLPKQSVVIYSEPDGKQWNEAIHVSLSAGVHTWILLKKYLWKSKMECDSHMMTSWMKLDRALS